MTEHTTSKLPPSAPRNRPHHGVPIVIAVAVVTIIALGALLLWRADGKTNKVALSSTAKPVSVVAAIATTYRPSRNYVGTLEPWVQANIGPQLVSAYVDTVLVRPGASVKRGDVIATLDCRNASAAQRAVAGQARALDERQRALSHQASRTLGLLDGGFVSPNEAEQQSATSAAEYAELEATKAKLAGSALEVGDCVLRAPFDGEVAQRMVDPGAFVRPGISIVTVVDRSTVRMTADAPELDFDVISPGTAVTLHLYATNQDLAATITRRAPAADLGTRTVHFEIDVVDPRREIPVGTTGEVHLDVGAPVPASLVPLYAATLRGSKAAIFVVEGGLAHARTIAVEGERNGNLYLDRALAPGTEVVTEGRTLLDDGDRVTAKVSPEVAPAKTEFTASAASAPSSNEASP